MERVERFKTVDGKLFEDQEKARKHEALLKDISRVLSILPKNTEPACNWENGSGYYQLTREQVEQFTHFVGILITENMGQETAEAFAKNPKGFVGRILCDSDTPLYGLWIELTKIDSRNRYWGQPYFAMNPGEGKQVCLDKR